MRLSNTSIKDFRDCPKKYYYLYEQRLEPKEEAWSLIDGRAFHRALEIYYSKQDPHPAEPINVTDLINDCIRWSGFPLEELSTPFLTAMAYIENYYASLENSDYHRHLVMGQFVGYALLHDWAEFDEIKPEMTVEIEEVYKFTKLKTRVDAYVRIKNSWWILETKTTSEDSKERFLDRISMDWQPTCELYCFRKAGYPVEAVIYNVVKKPRLFQTVLESTEGFHKRLSKTIIEDAKSSTPKYFYREEIFRSPKDLEEFEQSLKQVIMDVDNHYLNNLWYQNTQRCFEYGGCLYLKICQESEDFQKEEIIKTHYKRRGE